MLTTFPGGPTIKKNNLAQKDPLQKCVGDFCRINFGGFCRGFSWRIFLGTFSHKNEEKNPARKSAKKSGGPKNINPAKNPFCQKPTLKSCSKFSISIELFNLARKFLSRHLDFPITDRAAVGGSLANFILARNFQSRSRSRNFLIFGPSGLVAFRTQNRSVLATQLSQIATLPLVVALNRHSKFAIRS